MGSCACRNKKERPVAELEWRAETTFPRIMECRPQCGACCIAPSISSPIPEMPEGKPAGVACVQLLPDYRCALFGHPERPVVCVRLRPLPDMCGATREQALGFLAALEQVTRPAARRPCFERRAKRAALRDFTRAGMGRRWRQSVRAA